MLHVCECAYNAGMQEQCSPDGLNADSVVIDRLGGPTVAGRLCKVSPQAVSQWRRTGIPQPRRMYLELLRPDAFQCVTTGEEQSGVVRHVA